MSRDRDRYRGMMLGTAVGDTLGLPAEGILKQRNRRIFRGRWEHRFLPGAGMLSDDTEHTVFMAQGLLAHPSDVDGFSERLAWSLRWWLLSLPAGIGFGTMRAIVRMWLGRGPGKSGVRSAGNGPAMRIAPVGAFFANDAKLREKYTKASTVLTHTDPRALTGARAVAEIIAWIFREQPGEQLGEQTQERPAAEVFLALIKDESDDEWTALMDKLAIAMKNDIQVEDFAISIGAVDRVSGYIYQSVPVALYAWYRHFGDFRETLTSVLDLGGDTDTAGAIVGAMAGAVTGDKGIPGHWIEGIRDWPRGRGVLYELADRLQQASVNGESKGTVRYFWPGVIPRNAFFLILILAHGLRRLLPPY